MFRRLSNTLPADPTFPADLEKLGYHINEQDQIRSIAHPDQEFNFFISKNERVRETQRAAMDACVRAELSHRFASAGLKTTRLPLNAGPTDPHIPILTTPNLRTAKRLVLYIGESMQDLGVFAYRTIGQVSIRAGSALDFITTIKNERNGAEIAIVIANPGQLIWYRRGGRAMTLSSWKGLPRKNGVSEPMRIDEVKNRVPGHENVREHVARVFEMVGESLAEGCVVDIVVVGNDADAVVGYLDKHWSVWDERVRAVCLGLGFAWNLVHDMTDEKFKRFWGERARAYLAHSETLDTPLYGRKDLGCNAYSAGEASHTECIMPIAYKSMLAFFLLVNDVPGYFEMNMEIEVDEEDPSRVVTWIAGDESGISTGETRFAEPAKAG